MLIKQFETDAFLKNFEELDFRFNANQYGTNDVKLFVPGEPGSGLEFLKFKGYVIELFRLRNRFLGYPVTLNQIAPFDRIQPEMKIPEYGWSNSDEALEQQIFNDPLSFGSLDAMMIEVRKNLYPATQIIYDDEDFEWWFFEGCNTTTFYKVHGLFQKYAGIYRYNFLESILPGLGSIHSLAATIPFAPVEKSSLPYHFSMAEKAILHEASEHLNNMEVEENTYLKKLKGIDARNTEHAENKSREIDKHIFKSKLERKKFNPNLYAHKL